MKTSPTRIIFFGTPDFAVPSLRTLIDHGQGPIAVVTAPDRPAGRKQALTPPPVKVLAQEHGIPVFQPATLKDAAFLAEFRNLKPDLAVVVAYGKIIPNQYLNIPPFGYINLHPSLLPRYRGPSPIQAAILNGDKKTGVSVMRLDAEIDHGPILVAAPYAIPETAYYPEVEHALAELGAELLADVVPKYLNGSIAPQEQDHTHATFCSKLSREDGKIDWTRPAGDIYNHIRALSHEPGAWTTWRKNTLRIHTARPLDSVATDGAPGRVLAMGETVAVLTGNGVLGLDMIQLPGGKPMAARTFLNGHPEFKDAVLG